MDHHIKDYPAVIVLKEKHNHPIYSADSLRYGDMSLETKNKLSMLFRCGHTPSSALHSLKMDLMIEFGDIYYKVAADVRYLPTSSIIAYFFKKEFEAEYGTFSGENMFIILGNFLVEYSEHSGGKGKFQKSNDGNHYYVVMITPLML